MNETEDGKILDKNNRKLCILQSYKENKKTNEQFNNIQGNLK